VKLTANPSHSEEALSKAVAQCFEDDHVDVVIIGVGPLGQAAIGLARSFNENVIAPIPAAVRRLVAMMHGMPPILKAQSMGMEPSLSVDVECTLAVDFFTQMRSRMNLRRALVNQMILDQNTPPDTLELAASNNWGLPTSAASVAWPKRPTSLPAPLTTRDVLHFATMNGAKALRLFLIAVNIAKLPSVPRQILKDIPQPPHTHGRED
jgi:hypothetical protein